MNDLIPEISQASSVPKSSEHQESRTGRTGWDLIEERILSRKARSSQSWVNLTAMLAIICVVVYLSKIAIFDVPELLDEVSNLNTTASELRNTALQIKESTETLNKLISQTPSTASWFGRHNMDVKACKALGVEALERAGGQGVNASQVSTAWATFRQANEVPAMMTLVHCPADGIVYIYSAGANVGKGEGYVQSVAKMFKDKGAK